MQTESCIAVFMQTLALEKKNKSFKVVTVLDFEKETLIITCFGFCSALNWSGSWTR